MKDQAVVDKEIEELEQELEIARLESKLAKLRNAKKSGGGFSSQSQMSMSGLTSAGLSPKGSHDTEDSMTRRGSHELEVGINSPKANTSISDEKRFRAVDAVSSSASEHIDIQNTN